MNDLDQERASELRRTREQLHALADAARRFRDLVLSHCACSGQSSFAVKLLAADTALRDVLLIVARMRRF